MHIGNPRKSLVDINKLALSPRIISTARLNNNRGGRSSICSMDSLEDYDAEDGEKNFELQLQEDFLKEHVQVKDAASLQLLLRHVVVRLRRLELSAGRRQSSKRTSEHKRGSLISKFTGKNLLTVPGAGDASDLQSAGMSPRGSTGGDEFIKRGSAMDDGDQNDELADLINLVSNFCVDMVRADTCPVFVPLIVTYSV